MQWLLLHLGRISHIDLLFSLFLSFSGRLALLVRRSRYQRPSKQSSWGNRRGKRIRRQAAAVDQPSESIRFPRESPLFLSRLSKVSSLKERPQFCLFVCLFLLR